MIARKVRGLVVGYALAAMGLGVVPPPSEAATWVPIEGNVRLANGTPVCAMVLANGQYMFSCNGTGAYNMTVPMDENDQVTVFAFADGFAPFRTTMGRMDMGSPLGIRMQMAAQDSPQIAMSRDATCSSAPGWIRITGDVEAYGSQPLCAMVLSNGQYMFSCDASQGQYDLTVPVDENGQVTVFGFADGFLPYKDTFIAPVCGAGSPS